MRKSAGPGRGQRPRRARAGGLPPSQGPHRAHPATAGSRQLGGRRLITHAWRVGDGSDSCRDFGARHGRVPAWGPAGRMPAAVYAGSRACGSADRSRQDVASGVWQAQHRVSRDVRGPASAEPGAGGEDRQALRDPGLHLALLVPDRGPVRVPVRPQPGPVGARVAALPGSPPRSVVLLYASVLVHELSHSPGRPGFGLPVRRILLYPLGGSRRSSVSRPRPARSSSSRWLAPRSRWRWR